MFKPETDNECGQFAEGRGGPVINLTRGRGAAGSLCSLAGWPAGERQGGGREGRKRRVGKVLQEARGKEPAGGPKVRGGGREEEEEEEE